MEIITAFFPFLLGDEVGLSDLFCLSDICDRGRPTIANCQSLEMSEREESAHAREHSLIQSGLVFDWEE